MLRRQEYNGAETALAAEGNEDAMTDQLRFDNEVVIVTGAGGGLGRSYARDLARRGAKVVVNDLGGTADGQGSDSSAAAKVVAEIEAAGGEAIASFDSVATPKGGHAIVRAALDKWGRLDALVSNAGILRDRSFAKLDFDETRAVLDVHLWGGGFYVAQPAFNAMKDGGRGGRILLTTSASGLLGNFGQTSYGAAKMGLVGIMRTLAIEGQKAGIKVNAIAPIAGTRLTNNVSDDPAAPKAPDKVAPLAIVLAHRDCPDNGEIYMAGAGWFARVFIGLAPGWTSEGESLTAETLLANWAQAGKAEGFSEPRCAADISEILKRVIG
jgi:NAD(P)-dependent dehydrogenase (short-subunit alcohol dehydrogenase family)